MREKIFYGWVVVAISFVTIAIGLTMRSSFTVFYMAILRDFGWSRASTASAYSLALVTAGLAGLVMGALIDCFGPRVVMPVGAAILSLGLVSLSRMSTVWEFYFWFGFVVSVGVSALWWVPHAAILSNWFVKKRSTALGIAMAGMGTGGVMFLPLIQYLILRFGWRETFVMMGIAVFLTLVPLTAIFQRHKPEDMGLVPDGAPESGERKRRADSLVIDQVWASTDWTIATALRTWRLWLLFFVSVGTGFRVSVIDAHQVAHIVDSGFEPMVAATAVGIAAILGSAGSVAGGFFSDRLGREMPYTLTCLLVALGIVILILIRDMSHLWLLSAFALFFGIGSGANTPLLPAIQADLFQGRHFGSIFGFTNLGFGLGGFIGPWFAGAIFDGARSYTLAFSAVVAVVLATVLLVWIAAPRKVRLVGGRVASAEAPLDFSVDLPGGRGVG
jgi:MFS family permease